MHNFQNCFRIVVMYISVCMCMEICAQNFNPKQIEQERQTFITRQARLCSSDSVVFFKLFNELQNSKRELHKQIKILSKKVPTTNEERRQLVYDIDNGTFDCSVNGDEISKGVKKADLGLFTPSIFIKKLLYS